MIVLFQKKSLLSNHSYQALQSRKLYRASQKNYTTLDVIVGFAEIWIYVKHIISDKLLPKKVHISKT